VTIFGANAIAIFKVKNTSGRTQMHLYGNPTHPRQEWKIWWKILELLCMPEEKLVLHNTVDLHTVMHLAVTSIGVTGLTSELR
jgi:hypothetical protein